MIGWLIALGVPALILTLLLTPLILSVDYNDSKNHFFWRLSWLGISLLNSKQTGLIQRIGKRSSKKKETCKNCGKRKKAGIHSRSDETLWNALP